MNKLMYYIIIIMNKQEISELEHLKVLINTKLEDEDYYHIYYILKDSGEDVTLNKKKGAFFDLMSVQKKTLDTIKKIVAYRITQ